MQTLVSPTSENVPAWVDSGRKVTLNYYSVHLELARDRRKDNAWYLFITLSELGCGAIVISISAENLEEAKRISLNEVNKRIETTNKLLQQILEESQK